jgi:SAM-dependent methyltransferase
MLPETSILLKREKFTDLDLNQEENTGETYRLDVSADVGAVMGHASPGMRMISIRLRDVDAADGIRFMRDLIHEIIDVHQGMHPNPAKLPEGTSDWPFARQLNQKAYDLISEDYQETYFSNPLLTEMFDAWLDQLPAGGHILDAGCGHGDPVIARLLEKDYRVTGTDPSAKMLDRARTNFPNVVFINQMVGDIRSEAAFDGACSFSSLLYLDPIDLSHSLYRLYHALKPGGLLFLYAYDTHPSWRGVPYDIVLDQWMWSWSYGMEEAVQTLEEFGFFKALKCQDVSTEEQKEKQIADWRTYTQEAHDKLVKSWPGANIPAPDLSKVPQNLPYAYAIIARREQSGM